VRLEGEWDKFGVYRTEACLTIIYKSREKNRSRKTKHTFYLTLTARIKHVMQLAKDSYKWSSGRRMPAVSFVGDLSEFGLTVGESDVELSGSGDDSLSILSDKSAC
jgi:hypothetical protein